MIKWLTTQAAADYLGYSWKTLANSRKTKRLGGKEAPKYHRSGSCIRYDIAVLDAWMGG